MSYKGSILTLDPGESTGWTFLDAQGNLHGGTAPKSHSAVAQLIIELAPDLVVYENFRMYPGKAQSLVWNSFYPCEVIGVIKYVCDSRGIKYVDQAPSVKKYAGGFDHMWSEFAKNHPFTEHTKDAYLHLRYYLRNKVKK